MACCRCANTRSFQGQIDYFGDFRVLFDYYFPGVLPGTAINVPAALMTVFGSSNDLRLNFLVQRFASSTTARTAVHAYETRGNLTIPMVTLHTIGDPIIPAWHELLYLIKADTFARTQFTPLSISRYGHCSFTTLELLFAFFVTNR